MLDGQRIQQLQSAFLRPVPDHVSQVSSLSLSMLHVLCIVLSLCCACCACCALMPDAWSVLIWQSPTELAHRFPPLPDPLPAPPPTLKDANCCVLPDTQAMLHSLHPMPCVVLETGLDPSLCGCLCRICLGWLCGRSAESCCRCNACCSYFRPSLCPSPAAP